MTQQQSESWIRTLAIIITATITILGFWFFLHGGLSLLGGFGLERYTMKERGIEPPTTAEMALECSLGFVVFCLGYLLYIKTRLRFRKDIPKKAEPPWQTIMKWAILILLLFLILFGDIVVNV